MKLQFILFEEKLYTIFMTVVINFNMSGFTAICKVLFGKLDTKTCQEGEVLDEYVVILCVLELRFVFP